MYNIKLDEHGNFIGLTFISNNTEKSKTSTESEKTKLETKQNKIKPKNPKSQTKLETPKTSKPQPKPEKSKPPTKPQPKPEKTLPWFELSNVTDKTFIQKVNDKTLIKADLQSLELTSLLRAAHYNKYIQHMTKKHLNYESLPILSFIHGTQTAISLKPHQLLAMEFMRSREKLSGRIGSFGICGGILHMEMGLMKTITATAYSTITPKKGTTPTLVIASKTIMSEWKNEFKKFFGENLKVMYYHPDLIGPICSVYRDVNTDMMNEHTFVVTTYDVVSRASTKEEHPLYKIVWERIICDESQTFANPETLVHKSILKLRSNYKWCLTGTPIRNTSSDLWAQLKFCGYSHISTKNQWEEQKSKVMTSHNLQKAIFSANYKDVGIILPEKKFVTKNVILENLEKKCYERILKRMRIAYRELEEGETTFSSIIALFMRLRQACIAPYLLTCKEKPNSKTVDSEFIDRKVLNNLTRVCDTLLPWMEDINGTAGIYSSKMTAVIEILEVISKKEKVIIFSSFSSALTLLKYAISSRMPGIKAVQVDGSVKGPKREEVLDHFRSSNKDSARVLLMTYKVGSAGLNLTQANHVICLEKFWNNATHNQASARAWRPGQEQNVYVYDIHTKNSIEDKIKEICETKDEIIATTLMGSVVINNTKKGLTKKMVGIMLED